MVLFWLVAGLAVGKDIVDIFTSLLDVVGLALQVIPVIGTAAGIAISFLSGGIDIITSMVINFTMFAYFAYIGGGLGRRLAVMSIGAIIDVIPGLNLLPLTTVMFFLAFFLGKLPVLNAANSAVNFGKKILHV